MSLLPPDVSARKIAQLVRERKVSTTEVAREFIRRVEAKEPQLKAWIHFDRELVLRNAEKLDVEISRDPKLLEKPLLGVPVGVKDIFNTIDMPTCMGSPLWQGFTPGNDARVVHYCRYEGAQILGKTVTAEFAVHNPGPTRNPHDFKRHCGTSSSGSAVGVASGMIPLSLGTQTAGSIIRPASYCGTYGLKPSFGLLPRTGVLKTTDTLDTIGLFAGNVGDLETAFEILHVRGPNYPLSDAVLSTPRSFTPNKGRKWKIGWVKTHTWENAHPYAREFLQSFAKDLAKLPDVESVTEFAMPGEFAKSHEVHADIYDKCLAYYFRKEFESKELVSKTMNELITRGRSVTPARYRQALQEQVELSAKFDAIMADYDFLVSLSVAGEAPLETEQEPRDSCLVWTLFGAPTMNLPRYKGPNGLPVGIQLVTRKYYDRKMFRLLADHAGALGLRYE